MIYIVNVFSVLEVNLKTISLILAALLVVLTVPANAQNVQGQLQLYADETGTDCIIQDVSGLVNVYVYFFDYYSDEGITAVQFGAPLPSCWTGAIWLGDITPYPIALGDSQLNDPRGWQIAFGQCLTPPVYVGRIMYLGTGLAPTCCPYPIVKADDGHPEFSTPLGVNCTLPNPSLFGVEAGTSYVNGDHTCPCIWPVPVQETTWGQVKALYR